MIDVRCIVDDNDVSPVGNMAKINIFKHSATLVFGAHESAGQKPLKNERIQGKLNLTLLQRHQVSTEST